MYQVIDARNSGRNVCQEVIEHGGGATYHSRGSPGNRHAFEVISHSSAMPGRTPGCARSKEATDQRPGRQPAWPWPPGRTQSCRLAASGAKPLCPCMVPLASDPGRAIHLILSPPARTHTSRTPTFELSHHPLAFSSYLLLHPHHLLPLTNLRLLSPRPPLPLLLRPHSTTFALLHGLGTRTHVPSTLTRLFTPPQRV